MSDMTAMRVSHTLDSSLDSVNRAEEVATLALERRKRYVDAVRAATSPRDRKSTRLNSSH